MDSLTATPAATATPATAPRTAQTHRFPPQYEEWLKLIPKRLRRFVLRLLRGHVSRRGEMVRVEVRQWCGCCHSSCPSIVVPFKIIYLSRDASDWEIGAIEDEWEDAVSYPIENTVRVVRPPLQFKWCLEDYCLFPEKYPDELAFYMWQHPDFHLIPESLFKWHLERSGCRRPSAEYQRFEDAYTVWRMPPAERERFFGIFALESAEADSSTFLSTLPKDVLGLIADQM